MKYRIGHYDYNEDRTGNPYLFTVIGTPEHTVDWEKYRGETRQTMTIAEIEAAGIPLPDAIGAGMTEAAKRIDALAAQAVSLRAEIAALNEKLAKAEAAIE